MTSGAQPSYFLYLTVPPNTIDINIHPTKTEIKFDDEHAMYAILNFDY
jgi:DNA mismatch repair protein MutL